MIFVWVYLVGAAVVVVPFARGVVRWIAAEFPETGLQVEDYTVGAVIGLAAAAFWPVTLLVLAIAHLARTESAQ